MAYSLLFLFLFSTALPLYQVWVIFVFYVDQVHECQVCGSVFANSHELTCHKRRRHAKSTKSPPPLQSGGEEVVVTVNQAGEVSDTVIEQHSEEQATISMGM